MVALLQRSETTLESRYSLGNKYLFLSSPGMYFFEFDVGVAATRDYYVSSYIRCRFYLKYIVYITLDVAACKHNL